MTIICYEDFEKVDIRAGTIVRVEAFPRAKKPAYKLWVNFGQEIGTLQTSAQVTTHYTAEELLNKQIIGCLNLGPKNIAGFTSEFLLLGFPDEQNNICLPALSLTVPNGRKIC